jgi:hypothetical protein
MVNLKLVNTLISAIVVTHARHEGDATGSQAGGGHGLVGSFAAGKDQELIPAHRFPRCRKLRPAHNIVGIRSPDNNDIPFRRMLHWR